MAQRIQNKRSSISGKRPDASYLEPGELALNTNSSGPGLFFETNDGAIAKVGPTHVGLKAPQSEVGYGIGETWYDTGNGVLRVWQASTGTWEDAIINGTDSAFTVYVHSQSPESSDDLTNDGVARPFATINRACIEIARRSILRGRVDDPYNDKFAIVLLTGDNVAYNEPGLDLKGFEANVAAFTDDQSLTLDVLRSFNSTGGGVILPRGASILSFDLRKSHLVPTYYPKWSRETYEGNPSQLEGRTSVIKWTGNSFVTNTTFNDKISEVSVSDIAGLPTETAVLTSLEPHGYRALQTDQGTIVVGDKVALTYPETVSRTYEGEPTVSEGDYFAEPITPRTFRLRRANGEVLLRRELPLAPSRGSYPSEFLNLTYANTSHHRLSAISFATNAELNEYYSKVQRAFANLNFGGEVDSSEVSLSENTIVAPLPQVPTQATDSTRNGSPYINNCSLRSNWGLCGLTNDGALVKGFKSVLTASFTCVSLQNDAEVFEVYYNNNWLALKDAYAKANNVALSTVTNEQAIGYLISSVDIENLRYYYRTAYDIPSDSDKSSGLTDDSSDTRHYHTLCMNGGLGQIAQSFAIGSAVNFWTRSGGTLSISSANSNFGGQAIRAEGFAGIGTTGGSLPSDQNFSVTGVRRPRNVAINELKDEDNHAEFYLNSNVETVSATSITFKDTINREALLPFTLKPGTVIWAENFATGSPIKATIASAGLSADGFTLSLETTENGFDGVDVSVMSPPYLRRFIDPRTEFERGYSLYVTNTSTNHRPPQLGSVLRLAEAPGPGAQNLLIPGRQLDPGENGGWNHVFSVTQCVTQEDGDSPNHSKGADARAASGRSTGYYVSLSLQDSFKPWAGDLSTATDEQKLYARGAFVTSQGKSFIAEDNNLSPAGAGPGGVGSVWSQSRTFAVCQLTDEAWVPDFEAAEDPNKEDYTDKTAYLRGVPAPSSDEAISLAIDEDDGTDSLGLEGTGDYEYFADPAKIDPDFAHSKLAILRFLNLLGYTDASIGSFLKPVTWSNRNLSVFAMPAPSGEGYALSSGLWPVEFNRPSSIISPNHFWEYVGYFPYSKGLPRYQSNPLTRTQQFDYLFAQAWGGQVSCLGLMEDGTYVRQSIGEVDGRGRMTSGG